ncbi:MAG: amidohydrolase family protein [Saprospiraceae bacterium]|nr:amidohydrolase family protein [Saprospiraceae bacterium]
MKIIDSHQHFWNFQPARDTWMTPGTMDKIRRDFQPEDLLPLLDRHNIDGTVAIQVDQTEDENEFLLSLAKKHPWILGVVGWIDLKSPDIEEKLSRFKDPKLVGFRHILQSEPAEFMADPHFIAGLEQLSRFNFTYDLLIYWHQLEAAIELASELPDLHIVLDHIAKPDIRDGRILKWSRGIRKLADMPNVYCKISGMVTEAHWQYWKPDDFTPYLNLVFETFGPDRCMFGSDWPVCTLAATYQDWFEYVSEFISVFDAKQQENIMGGNCRRFYKLLK